jgi:biopolymer transport protein ExbB
MNLTEKLLPVALLGAEWVLWLLVGLSVISVAIMIERVWYYRTTDIDFEAVLRDLKSMLGKADVGRARDRVKSMNLGIEREVVAAGLSEYERGAEAVEKAMLSAKARMKLRLEKNLAYLGTVGNNAPFVGLFGTVIGVIRAFHDLAAKKGQGPEAVMGSLSEALIATAVGLLVAIPAVVAFNYFNRRVRARMSNTDSLAQLLLSELREPARAAAGAK